MESLFDFLYEYGLIGLLIGFCTFLIIGIFHPLVIKGEYYFGPKIKWAFLIGGLLFLFLSIIADNIIFSVLAGVTSFSSFWGIKEVEEQVERVKKGWFPANPKRKTEIYNSENTSKSENI